MPNEIEALRNRFRDAGVQFETAGEGLVKLLVRNDAATAEIFTLGATVTAYQPAGQRPVIFTSAETFLKPGKAIRGGVPICWPWFGPHPSDAKQPQHGLVRNKPWNVEGVRRVDSSTTEVELSCDAGDASARLVARIGKTLRIALRSKNKTSSPMRLEEALHTYLVVGDSRQVEITGLENLEFIDKVDGGKRKKQEGAVKFTGETDRVYLNHDAACMLRDPVLKRATQVNKSGSRSTVVWNPWSEKAKGLADFGDDEWQKMCCIETANAADNAIQLAPGAEHETVTEISVS